MLGITFTADLQNLDDLNFQTKILAIEKEINQWSKRNLTPLGRITVVKTLLLPKLTHILISLPKPNDMLIKTLETSFFRYIWCGKKDKITRSTMVQDYKNGGCKMIRIDSYIKSLKLTWLRRLLRSECSWTKLFCDICNCSLSKLQSCGDYYSNVCACNTTIPFWKETLHILQDFHYCNVFIVLFILYFLIMFLLSAFNFHVSNKFVRIMLGTKYMIIKLDMVT